MGNFFNPVQTTYSFEDLAGAITNPLLPAPIIIAGGNIGIGQITIRMTTQRTEHELAADGTVMPSYIPGDNAEITVEVQQTSDLHHELLSLYTLLTTAAQAGDISNWVSTNISLRTILDGSVHVMSGVSFQKIPDKPYAARGAHVTWVLMAASCINQ